jgi:hypothetical protein
MRHAGLLVEFNDGSLSIGSELGIGSPQCIGGLQRMPTLHAALAFLATANVNIELALNGPTWNLDLILLVGVRLRDVAAAVGTSVGQRRLVDLVDPLGRLAMGLGAVVLAGFATGFLRLGLGRPLRERSSLAFAGAALFIEKARQPFDLSALSPDDGTKLGDFAFEAQTVEAWCFGHTFTVAARAFFSCASLPRKCEDFDEKARRR